MSKLVRLPRRRLYAAPAQTLSVDLNAVPTPTHFAPLRRSIPTARHTLRGKLLYGTLAVIVMAGLGMSLLPAPAQPAQRVQPVAAAFAVSTLAVSLNSNTEVMFDAAPLLAEGELGEQVITGDLWLGSPLDSGAAAIQLGTTTDENVRLRREPSTSSDVITKLPKGTTLEVIGQRPGWYRVATTKTTVGWISAQYLTLKPSTSDTPAVTKPTAPATTKPTKPSRPTAPQPTPLPAQPTPERKPASVSQRWVQPTKGRLTSNYGYRGRTKKVFHNGLDIANKKGTPIVAVSAGKVIEAGWCRGYGYCVKIDHGNGIRSEYGHMAWKPPVRRGAQVSAGQLIGYMGSTYDRAGGGYSTGNHVHFTLRRNGQAINPWRYLPK